MKVTTAQFTAICLILGFFLVGCDMVIFQSPTKTPTITITLTPFPTSTQTAVLSRTYPPIILGDTLFFPSGGFSLQFIIGYDITLHTSQATIMSPDGNILFSIIGTTLEENTSPVIVLGNFLENAGKDIEEFEVGEPFTMTVREAEALAADVTGVYNNDPFAGRVIVASEDRQQYLYAFLLAFDDHWPGEGEEVFNKVIQSIDLFKPKASEDCEVSTDPTYGFSQENPIKVGGDWLAGPQREELYLDSLLGLEGEEISYIRMGSMPFGNTILDAYQITYGNVTVTLYLDEYSYEPLLAPAGFTCSGPIPLQEP